MGGQLPNYPPPPRQGLCINAPFSPNVGAMDFLNACLSTTTTKMGGGGGGTNYTLSILFILFLFIKSALLLNLLTQSWAIGWNHSHVLLLSYLLHKFFRLDKTLCLCKPLNIILMIDIYISSPFFSPYKRYPQNVPAGHTSDDSEEQLGWREAFMNGSVHASYSPPNVLISDILLINLLDWI